MVTPRKVFQITFSVVTFECDELLDLAFEINGPLNLEDNNNKWKFLTTLTGYTPLARSARIITTHFKCSLLFYSNNDN